jgi:hypothetical protein
MVKPSFVKQFINEVTPDQIGACSKILDCQTHTNFYLVQSESDDQVEYKVTYDHKMGFQCSCEAGKRGFAHCKYGFCKHIKWSVAHAAEERAKETARLARATAIALAHSCAMEICSTDDCIQLAGPSGKCMGHTGTLTDKGMQAWMADRADGKDINLGRPAWIMK